MRHLINIAVAFLSLSACTAGPKLSSGAAQQAPTDRDIVDIRGAPLAEWSLNEHRGRSLLQHGGDVLPRRGIRLFDDGQRALILDTAMPRIFETSSSQLVSIPSSGRGAVSTSHNFAASSIASCPHWSFVSPSGVLPNWAHEDSSSFPVSSIPLLARYDVYDVAQFASGIRLLSRHCVLRSGNIDPEFQHIESLGQLVSNDVRFGLEVEFSLLPFRELETAISAWGGELRFQEIAVQSCELEEFWEYAIEGTQRALHMREGGIHRLEIQDRVDEQWKLRSSFSFSTEADALAYLKQHQLPSDFYRFNFGWRCTMAPTLDPHGHQANVLWVFAMQLDQLPPMVHQRFEMDDEFVSSSVDARYSSQQDALASIVAHIEAEIRSKRISTAPGVHYWSELTALEAESFQSSDMSELGLMWELVLPPLQLEPNRLDEVRRLRQALKAARPDQHLDVRGGQPAGLHINVEIPRNVIEQGDAWEVARRYLVFWMRHRQRILDSYFPSAELPSNRHEYFGPIPNVVVDELEALDLSRVDLPTWLAEQLEQTTPDSEDVDVNIESASEGRLEIRVSSNDLSEPWQNVEARIRFCVGLMRHVLNSLKYASDASYGW
ncbi:MAG: hypothetical protein H6714_01125 [Myxococcales bacterium]|nr:hypothetical protein [Myxococcales bacterium]